jgi:glycosyltransferase involved in cell wall biosynthesis
MNKQNKRILFLFNAFVSISGGDVRFIEIAKRLMRKNVEVWVVTSKLGMKICSRYGLNARYILTTNEDKISNIFYTYFVRIIKALLMKLELKEGDLLYSTSDFLPDVLPAFILKLRNKNVRWIQIIHHLYENPFRRRGKNLLINLLGFLSQRVSFAIIKRKADLIVTVNPLVKEQLLKLGFSMQKIEINYDGADLMNIEKIKVPNKKYDCVFLGRLAVSKGIFDLIKIWKIVVSEKPEATLAIIGGGDRLLEQKLRKTIEENNLEGNISILGYLKDDEKFRVLKSSKLFVFPSYEEGFGIAICEAMACGLPVIAWNLPIYCKIFPKGIVKVHLGNTEKFANEILRLLNDSKLYEKLRKDAIEMSSKYDWNKIAEKELKLLRRVSYIGFEK